MEWILVLNLICANEADLKDRPDCKEHITKCIEWVESQPQTQGKDLTRFDIAVLLQTDQKLRKAICKD